MLCAFVERAGWGVDRDLLVEAVVYNPPHSMQFRAVGGGTPIVMRQLAVRQARVRFSAPTMEIPLLSSSSEENGVDFSYCD